MSKIKLAMGARLRWFVAAFAIALAISVAAPFTLAMTGARCAVLCAGAGNVTPSVTHVFSTPGFATETIPSGYSLVDVTILGAAAGAGSGAREATGVIRTGGGGSSGGVHFDHPFPVASLGGSGSSFKVLVGVGGPGGAAQAVNSTAGSAGTVGDNTGIGSVWSLVTPVPTGVQMNGIASNATVLVLVGNSGTIYSSSDGAAWTLRTSNTANALNDVTWNGTKFVAVGAAGTIDTSPDGITWTTQTSNTANALNSVLWDGTTLTAVGVAGTIDTSPDTSTWTVNAFTSANTLNEAAWNGASSYIAVDNQGNVISASSPTGTWTAGSSITPNTGYQLFGIAFGNGVFVANASNGLIYTCTTTCGTAGNWTQHGNPGLRSTPLWMSFANGYFFTGQIISTDGVTWLQGGTGSFTPARVAYSAVDSMWHSAHATGFEARLAGISNWDSRSEYGGNPGSAGSTSATASGGASISTDTGTLTSGAGGASSSTAGGAAGAAGACAGGGAGGSADAANVNRAAARGGVGSNQAGGTQTFGDNGTAGALLPTTPPSQVGNLLSLGSSGAGGGAFNASTIGQDGADGASPCGGAGAGGAADNGFASGKGGRGGNGEVRLMYHNFLLLRDLDPASNDNTPVFLNRAA